jgi:hypothetical protein
MRCLFIVMLTCGVAVADAPRDRYRLEAIEGWQQIGRAKNRVPSCGPRATDFIAKIGTLNVEVANDVTINGVAWKPGPPSPNRISVVNDQLLEGFVIQVTFNRRRASTAGVLVVVGLSNDVLQCGDALKLEGRYER